MKSESKLGVWMDRAKIVIMIGLLVYVGWVLVEAVL